MIKICIHHLIKEIGKAKNKKKGQWKEFPRKSLAIKIIFKCLTHLQTPTLVL